MDRPSSGSSHQRPRSAVGYLWIPHLPLAVALRRHPDVDGHPVVVGGSPSSDGAVVDTADECLAAGVRIGQPLREAHEFCPRAVFLPADPTADRRTHEAVLDLVETVSPAIEDDGLGRACFVFEIHPEDDPVRVLTSLRALILRQLGLRVRLAVAPGKFAARVAVEQDHRCASGVPVVLGDDVAGYLAPLPVAALPLGPRALDRLRLLGITTVGQFAKLPRDNLTRRFGSEAALAHALANGQDDRPVVPRRRPEMRRARHTFEPGPGGTPADLQPLVAVAERLLERLCRALRTEGKAFRELRIAVEYEDGQFGEYPPGASAEKVAELRQPAETVAQCRATLRALAEALARGGPASAIVVTVAALGPAGGEQLSLLDQATGAVERRERLDRAVREVARRYPARLRRVRARELPTLLDEYHFALLPYEHDDRPVPSPTPETTVRRVEVVHRGGRSFLVEDGRSDEIVARHGRWQAEEWWPAEVSRTYLRVRTKSGRVCTLSRDAAGWRLVEVFD